jgi:argininosuccinate lyase
MRAATDQGFLTATDVADELVRRGVPFAQAHAEVGKVVRYCAERGKMFAELSPVEARQLMPAWDLRLRAIAASPEKAIGRRKVTGGTAPSEVARQLRLAARTLATLHRRA